MRDFTLQLRDGDREISSREYMEAALEMENGFEESEQKQDYIRTLLKGFFRQRDCVTLVRPMLDEDKLQSLSDQPYGRCGPTSASRSTRCARWCTTASP